MSSKHTPTPWILGKINKEQKGIIVFSYGADQDDAGKMKCVCAIAPLADMTDTDYANAARIVECVNACEGQDIETVKLATAHRNSCFNLEAAVEQLSDRNDRLRSALQGLINAVNPLDRLRTLDHAEVEAINDANQLLVELAQKGGSYE